MFLEILIIAVVIAFLLSKFQQKSGQPAAATPAANQAQARAPQAPAEQVKRVLTVDGTEPFTQPAGFVKGFGIDPKQLQDLRTFKGDHVQLENFPQRVRDCLLTVYQEGLGRGLVLSEIINHARPLKAGEALYFALIQRPQSQGAVVAFVDKSR